MIDHTEQDRELRALVQGLGARAAERLDVERTAAEVVRRLREQAAVAPAWWGRTVWLRVAAAVVLIVGVGLIYRQGGPKSPRPVGDQVVSSTDAGLSELSSDQLRVLLQALDAEEFPGLTAAQDAGLEDLDAGQLRALLRSLEG
jgi:hypothetical protein